jgi:hypothetical protein
MYRFAFVIARSTPCWSSNKCSSDLQFATEDAGLKFRMSKVLRFWLDVEHEQIKKHVSGRPRRELIAQILREGNSKKRVTPCAELPGKRHPGC